MSLFYPIHLLCWVFLGILAILYYVYGWKDPADKYGIIIVAFMIGQMVGASGVG